MSRHRAGDEDGQAGGVDGVELADGEGIFARAHLDGEARAAVALDEPVLVPGEGTCVGRILQGVAAPFGELLCQLPGTGNHDAPVLPVDHLPLGVPGDDDVGINALGVVIERLNLRLAQGEAPHEIPGAGAGVALGEFDLPGLEPPGGVLQVQVDPLQIGLPALREGDGRIESGQLLRLRDLFGGGGSRHQGDAVGVDHGDEGDGGGAGQFLRAYAADGAAGADGFGVVLDEFQEHRGGEPFVGMVGGGIEHPSLPFSDGHGADGTPPGGGCQFLHAQEGILRRQPLHQGIRQLRRHGNVSGYNGHKITS